MCLCIITSLHYIMCLSATIARMQKVPFVRATTKPFITHSSRAFHMCLTYNLPHWSCWMLANWQLHYLSGNGTAPHSQAIFCTVFWIHKQSLEADVLPLESWGCSSGLIFFPSMYQALGLTPSITYIFMCACWVLGARNSVGFFWPGLLGAHWPLTSLSIIPCVRCKLQHQLQAKPPKSLDPDSMTRCRWRLRGRVAAMLSLFHLKSHWVKGQ